MMSSHDGETNKKAVKEEDTEAAIVAVSDVGGKSDNPKFISTATVGKDIETGGVPKTSLRRQFSNPFSQGSSCSVPGAIPINSSMSNEADDENDDNDMSSSAPALLLLDEPVKATLVVPADESNSPASVVSVSMLPRATHVTRIVEDPTDDRERLGGVDASSNSKDDSNSQLRKWKNRTLALLVVLVIVLASIGVATAIYLTRQESTHSGEPSATNEQQEKEACSDLQGTFGNGTLCKSSGGDDSPMTNATLPLVASYDNVTQHMAIVSVRSVCNELVNDEGEELVMVTIRCGGSTSNDVDDAWYGSADDAWNGSATAPPTASAIHLEYTSGGVICEEEYPGTLECEVSIDTREILLTQALGAVVFTCGTNHSDVLVGNGTPSVPMPIATVEVSQLTGTECDSVFGTTKVATSMRRFCKSSTAVVNENDVGLWLWDPIDYSVSCAARGGQTINNLAYCEMLTNCSSSDDDDRCIVEELVDIDDVHDPQCTNHGGSEQHYDPIDENTTSTLIDYIFSELDAKDRLLQ